MDSEFILKTARQAIETFVRHGKKIEIPPCSDELKERRGVFVTIHKNGMLRGCIGFPYPVKPLIESLIESAISACHDPRFPALREDELNEIDIEVSILTTPELLKEPEKYINEIEIGRDGLIIEGCGRAGLLLPQVAVEQAWNKEEFLNAVCEKAGLPDNCWRDKKIKLYKFQCQIFTEKYK